MESRASLSHGPEGEPRRVRDRLDMQRRREVCIVAGDGREASFGQVRYSLGKGVAEVGVLAGTAVAREPGRVDRQFHQIGQPPDLLRAGRFAAWQGPEA